MKTIENNEQDIFRKPVSVCIATYNGGNYIAKQLDSILSQLDREDEIIICDDCSSDETVSIINGYNEPRIKMIKNPIRLGVLQNFEKCISNAKNGLIFLADQDDIWSLDKVKKISDLFFKNPELTLVLSNAQVIDESDRVIKDRLFRFGCKVNVGFFRAVKNIIKNNYLGAAIAFRKDMVKYFVPIPGDVPMHDMWIGIINDIYGKTYYLDEPLIQYRRHSTNASPGRHASLSQMVIWRYRLIKRLSDLLIRR